MSQANLKFRQIWNRQTWKNRRETPSFSSYQEITLKKNLVCLCKHTKNYLAALKPFLVSYTNFPISFQRYFYHSLVYHLNKTKTNKTFSPDQRMARTTTEVPSLNENKEQLFYDLSKKHIRSLNKKYQSKAVIDKNMREKIFQSLLHTDTEKKDSQFRFWSIANFEIQTFNAENILCDAKTKKPVLIYEDMYSIYYSIHTSTAHGGRDKCLDALTVNYSWYNRRLLEIHLKLCPSCQTRKTVKIPMFSKPIIELGITHHLHHFSLKFFLLTYEC